MLKYKYNKHKSTILGLARMFIMWEVDTKIPTIDRLELYFNVARGTIQSAIKYLSDNDAIKIESQGSMGTYLRAKDMYKLVDYADIKFMLGSLPMPEYKRSKAMATALFTSLENKYQIDIKMTYIRSVKQRFDLLENRRIDFAITSKRTALNMIEQGHAVEIVADFGSGSMYQGFQLIYSNQDKMGFWPNMKVAMTSNQMEQYHRTCDIFEKYNPQYIDVEYQQLNQAVLDGVADVVLRANDLIDDTIKHLPKIDLGQLNEAGSAVMIVNAKRKDLIYLLKELVDVEQINMIQTSVLNDEIIPQY